MPTSPREPEHWVFDTIPHYKDHPDVIQRWEYNTLRLTRFQHALMYAVNSLILRGRYDPEVAGKIYKPTNPTPSGAWKRVMKSQIIAKTQDKLLTARLEELGLTDSYIVDKIKKAIDIAEDKQDPAAMLKGVAEINKMKGNYTAPATNPANIPLSEGEQHLPDMLEEEFRRLTGTKHPNAEDAKILEEDTDE